MLTLVLWQHVVFLCVSRTLFRMSLFMVVLCCALNYNFSKEECMFPEDDRVIETCRSVLSVLMQIFIIIIIIIIIGTTAPFRSKAFFRSFCQLPLFLSAFLQLLSPQLPGIFHHTIFPS